MSLASLKDQIREFAEPMANRLGLFVYELEVTRLGKHHAQPGKLRVQLTAERVDKSRGGVTIDECVTLSRELGRTLELEEVVPAAYTLEVSSPGLERKLNNIAHYRTAVGERVRVILNESPEREVLEGTLTEIHEGTLSVEAKDAVHSVAISDIKRAQTVYKP